jgi:hypothetical protein
MDTTLELLSSIVNQRLSLIPFQLDTHPWITESVCEIGAAISGTLEQSFVSRAVITERVLIERMCRVYLWWLRPAVGPVILTTSRSKDESSH